MTRYAFGLVALLALAGCTAAPSPAPQPVHRSAEMPAGSGPVTTEPGFSAFCASHPGESLCP